MAIHTHIFPEKNHITHFTIEILGGDLKDIAFFIQTYQSIT